MNLQASVEVLRSKIAMFLHGTAGDTQARGLLEKAGTALMQAEWAISHWQQRAERAESLREAEVDDGK